MFKEFKKEENPIEKIKDAIESVLKNFGFEPGEITIEDKELSFPVTDISDENTHQEIARHLHTILVGSKNKLANDVFVIPHDDTDYEIVVKLM